MLHNVRMDNVHFYQGYDGKTQDNVRVGGVTLRVENNKSPHTEVALPFKNVLLMPSAPDNLLSMDKLEMEGWTVKFGFINSHRVCWLRKGHVELGLMKNNRRYRLKAMAVAVYTVPALRSVVQQPPSDSSVLVQRKPNDCTSLQRWHLRFAHLNLATLLRMAKNGAATGMGSGLYDDADSLCWTCKERKMTRMSSKQTVTRRATRSYQKLISDMCYVGVVTYNGYEHFQLVHDEASRYLWGFLLRRKQEATEVVMNISSGSLHKDTRLKCSILTKAMNFSTEP
ncbi:hypothetical protein PC110_g19627 [Phytophthora cactorum]|uniref:GAG-pre-integrase domain-containing protein n=1 Tax=Phytophthora cactorum TaxID=29920 RepID=A0A329RHP3_9STRA|nr:hypothetical protein PC110_g19627 [Phytophthora cactorum]